MSGETYIRYDQYEISIFIDHTLLRANSYKDIHDGYIRTGTLQSVPSSALNGNDIFQIYQDGFGYHDTTFDNFIRILRERFTL